MVSESAHNNARGLLGDREGAVLSHPHYRLHVIATRGLGMMARLSRFRTPAAFALAAAVNALGRQHLRHLADSMCFHDPRGMPAFLTTHVGELQNFDRFRTQRTAVRSESAPCTLGIGCESDGDARERYWRRAMGEEFLRLADHGEISVKLQAM